ncbi:MAG: GAF domain-containing protein [Deltaproteobacteria bacterium]|nr:GAF domain-containing protein [Deltaproteobacteria bacterium]
MALIGVGITSELSILRPVNSLVRASERIASGDLSARIESPDNDADGELGQLSRSFDHMAEALQMREAYARGTEEMLRESELRYRTLFEASPSGIVLRDPETMLPIDFNPTAHQQLGYTREEFARLRVHDYEAIERPEETNARLEKVLGVGRTNLKREQEKIAILREIDKVITSSLEPKAVLTLLLEKIGALLPYSAAAVLLLNKVTGELEPEAAWNINEQRWKEHMTRIRARGPLAMTVLKTRTPLAIVNLHTDPRPLEPQFFHQEGLVSYIGIPLTVKGEPLGVLIIYTKVEHEFSTEEVEFLSTLGGQAAIAIHNAELYDETRKLAIDLENAVRVKDDFLSVMSHELRTPLNVVMGYAAMMKDGMLGDLNPKQDDALGKILGRANDQLAMISNILFATAIDTAKIPVDHQGVILADLFNDLESAYHAQVTGPDLTLNWDCPPDLPILETDRAKLKQILQNLIDNAIKFTAKGQITISARHLAASPRLPLRDTGTRETGEAEKWVEFTVTDTGVGIPQDMVAAIFEKFRQVDSSETRPYGGVGMGLYIVKKFTEMLGGTVEVESEPGKGSTFTVRIPS